MQPVRDLLGGILLKRNRSSHGITHNTAPDPTLHAPHIRDSFNLQSAMRLVVVALIPCVIMAFINTGFQANVTIAMTADIQGDWRAALLDGLGIGYATNSFWSAVVHGGLYFLPVLAVILVVGNFWEQLFAKIRQRNRVEGLAVFALLFSLSLPPTIPLWQAALGTTFAIVVGKEIFGGTGKNFLNPVLVGVAFLYVTYPKEMITETNWTVVDAFTNPTFLQMASRAQDDPGTLAWLGTSWVQSFLGLIPGNMGTTSTLACLLGALLLLKCRLISGRTIFGILLGMILTVVLVQLFGDASNTYVGVTWYWHLVLGSFAFGTIFLATDPVTSAMTNTGRWIYGVVIGVLVVLIRIGNMHHPDGVMFAILIGNIVAPLIDYLVMWVNIRRRTLRNVG